MDIVYEAIELEDAIKFPICGKVLIPINDIEAIVIRFKSKS